MSDTGIAAVSELTRWVDDFPVPGVRFADLTPVFADATGFRAVVDSFAVMGSGVDLVAGIDARGFLLASGVAVAKGCGVLAIRKGGKLPPPVRGREYSLEYGVARLEIPADGIDLAGRKVLLLDDVLATGGTLLAAAELLADAGADVRVTGVVLELDALGGRDRVGSRPELGELRSLVRV